MLLFLTGLDPERVAAFMEQGAAAIDVVDALTIRFRDGALGVVGSTGAVVPVSHTDTLEYIIHGSAGHLHFDVMDGSLRLYTEDGITDEPTLPVADRYPMGAPARNLVDLARGVGVNGSPVSFGQRTVEILDAAYRSAAAGRHRHRHRRSAAVTSHQVDHPARAERVAIVTGAGGGLGSAVARLLAETRDYRLCLVDNRRDAVETVADEVRALGADAEALVVDLGSAEAAESVVPRTIDRFGRVDALVNAAAILHRRDFDAVTPKDFDDVFHINTLAPFLLARAAMPDMASRGWGRIVNVTSTGVYEGGFTMTSALYEASKGAVAVLTKMLARHGAADGILVNTVCPGGMRTGMLLNETSPELVAKAEREMIPLHRIADPAEIGRMIAWLVSDQNTYATGAEFDITGGLALH